MKFILASASPRRKELLHKIIPDFQCIPAEADEIIPENLPLFEAPQYLARIKAEQIAEQFKNAAVIGADTAVFSDNNILGKPKNRAHAKEMLHCLSGKTHRVITGCAVCYAGKTISLSQTAFVTFYPLTESEIDEYLDTDEPYDKAGAYGIQGKGGLFVKEIRGDFYNIMGLPVAALYRLLKTETLL